MKKKRFILYIVCCYMIYWLGRGGYWYHKLEGNNVPVILSTQFSPVPTSLSLFIDDKLCYQNDSLETMYEGMRFKLSFGFHHLKVVVDGEIFEENFLVFPVRWIYIQVQKGRDPNYKDDENWFYIEFSNTPTGLM